MGKAVAGAVASERVAGATSFYMKKPKQEGDFVAQFHASKPKLSDFLRKHDVCTYYSKNWTIGNPWIAWFNHPASDPEHRSFVQLVERYSMEACARRNLCATGRDKEDACRNLAKLNGLTFP